MDNLVKVFSLQFIKYMHLHAVLVSLYLCIIFMSLVFSLQWADLPQPNAEAGGVAKSLLNNPMRQINPTSVHNTQHNSVHNKPKTKVKINGFTALS